MITPPASRSSNEPSLWIRISPWLTSGWRKVTIHRVNSPARPIPHARPTNCASAPPRGSVLALPLIISSLPWEILRLLAPRSSCGRRLTRLDQAKATLQEARAHHVESPWVPLVVYMMNFLEHDTAGMDHQVAQALGKPGIDDQILFLQSETAAYGGELAQSRELTRRAADSAQRIGETETAAEYVANASIREALLGDMPAAKQDAQAAVAHAGGRQAQAFAAIALGLAGDSAQAERLAGELSKNFGNDTIVHSEYLPMIAAAMALHSGGGKQPIEALAASAPY